MDNFNLLVITPHKKIFEGEASKIACKNLAGEFSILANHENYITTTVPGKLIIVSGNNEEKDYFASGGVLEVKDGAVTLCVDTVETREEIDVMRAKLAKEKTEKKLENEIDSRVEDMRTKLALSRAIERIEFAKDKK